MSLDGGYLVDASEDYDCHNKLLFILFQICKFILLMKSVNVSKYGCLYAGIVNVT